ncbi:hypothetical protein AAG906_030684 [Vitis piasezkii]
MALSKNGGLSARESAGASKWLEVITSTYRSSLFNRRKETQHLFTEQQSS